VKPAAAKNRLTKVRKDGAMEVDKNVVAVAGVGSGCDWCRWWKTMVDDMVARWLKV